MVTKNNHNERPQIEQDMEWAGKEIERLMSYYPCLREVCKGLDTAAYPAALFVSACFHAPIQPVGCPYYPCDERGSECH